MTFKRIALAVTLVVCCAFIASADLVISTPKVSGSEAYKLMYQGVHVGWMTAKYKTASDVMTYEQKYEIGKNSDEVKLKVSKEGIEEVSIKGKDPEGSYKLAAKPEAESAQFEGTYDKNKRSYVLSRTNFLPATCMRFLAFDFVDFKKGDDLFALDPTVEGERPPATKTEGENGETKIGWNGNITIQSGKITFLSLQTYYGLVEAVACDEKEMKPKDRKAADKILESSKDFFETNLGVFEIEGYGEVAFSFNFVAAPAHCKRIRTLIERKWYVGKIHHRLACLAGEGKGRILQGGSGDGKGFTGCEDKVTVPLEAKAKHDKWAIGMARSPDPGSANSQFYYCLDEVHGLDGNYTVWGNVVEGTGVLDKMWADNYKGPSDSTPKNPLKISKCYFKAK